MLSTFSQSGAVIIAPPHWCHSKMPRNGSALLLSKSNLKNIKASLGNRLKCIASHKLLNNNNRFSPKAADWLDGWLAGWLVGGWLAPAKWRRLVLISARWRIINHGSCQQCLLNNYPLTEHTDSVRAGGRVDEQAVRRHQTRKRVKFTIHVMEQPYANVINGPLVKNRSFICGLVVIKSCASSTNLCATCDCGFLRPLNVAATATVTDGWLCIQHRRSGSDAFEQ